MAELIVNDVVQVAIQGLLGGRACVSVFHVDASRPIIGNSQDIAEKVLGAWQEHLVPNFSSSYTVTGATYIDLDSLTGDSGSIGPVPGQPAVGGQANGTSPQVALLVRKNVSASPRGVSFRLFLPPCSDAQVGPTGLLDAGYRAALQADLDSFRSDVDEAEGVGQSEWHLCCVSYPRGDDGKVNGPGSKYDLTDFELLGQVATQRRRLRG